MALFVQPGDLRAALEDLLLSRGPWIADDEDASECSGDEDSLIDLDDFMRDADGFEATAGSIWADGNEAFADGTGKEDEESGGSASTAWSQFNSWADLETSCAQLDAKRAKILCMDLTHLLSDGESCSPAIRVDSSDLCSPR